MTNTSSPNMQREARQSWERFRAQYPHYHGVLHPEDNSSWTEQDFAIRVNDLLIIITQNPHFPLGQYDTWILRIRQGRRFLGPSATLHQYHEWFLESDLLEVDMSKATVLSRDRVNAVAEIGR